MSIRLRTAVYWEISDKAKVPFLPDFIRIPIIAEYNARVRQSLRMFIAASVDKSVRNELEDALHIAEVNIIPLPSAVLNFLYIYLKEGLEQALDDLQQEFSEHKKVIIDWESRLRRADRTSYGEVLNVMKEMSSRLHYIRDWLNEHPFKNEANARLLCNLLTGGPSSLHNGIITEQEVAIRRNPSVLSCSRCRLVNALDNKFCSKCSLSSHTTSV